MNSKLRIVTIPMAVLAFIGVARMAYAQGQLEQVAQAEKSKSTESQSNKTDRASANDCSLLTPEMLEKVIGQPPSGKPEAQKAMPFYGGAWGWNCTYHVGYENHGGVKIQFSVFTEESAAKAKQDFDTYSAAAAESRGKPSIGDAAYWVESADLFLYVLKGKVHFSLELTPTNNEKQLTELASKVAARI